MSISGPPYIFGGRPRSIALQTSIGRNIPNEIAAEPGPQRRAAYARLRGRHPRWVARKAPVGRYNCFGHVFASRRTQILEPEAVLQVLEDDGYTRLVSTRPMPGDLAIYFLEDEPFHAGRIVSVQELAAGSEVWLSTVLSKWSADTGEDLHAEGDHPFTEQGFSVSVRYYSDRL